MPRQKPHSNARIPNPSAPRPDPADVLPADAASSTRDYAVLSGREHSATEALKELLRRDDGWLRIVPHETGSIVFAKWKFTSRKWPNHYVMYRSEDMDIAGMLWGLLRKVEAVDAGVLKPVYDHPYANE